MVAAGQEGQLIVEVAVHSGLDRSSADPDRLAAHQCRAETQQPAAPAPERHDPAWPRIPRRHRRQEGRAVFLVMLPASTVSTVTFSRIAANFASSGSLSSLARWASPRVQA